MSRTRSHTPLRADPPRSGRLAGFVQAAARRAARRPRLTVCLWLALIVACTASGSLVVMRTLSSAGSNVGESARADARLTAAGIENPATESILVRSGSARVTRDAVASLTASLRDLGTVRSAQSPRGLSRDGGRIRLVTVALRGAPASADAAVVPVQRTVAALATRSPGVTFLEAGDGSGARAINRLVDRGLHQAELISLPLTLLILVVAIAVIGSLTVLPAVLALLGDRVTTPARPLWGRRWTRGRVPQPRTAWTRIAEAVTARPRAALALAALVLAGLATPILGMHTGESGESEMPAGTPVVVADHAIHAAFPGTSDSAQLVAAGHDLRTEVNRRRLADLGRAGERLVDGRGPVSLRVARDGRTALVSVPVAAGNLAAGRRAVDVLRRSLAPATPRLVPGARAQITGSDAEGLDFTRRLGTVTPFVIAFVLTLAFLLLVTTFGAPRLALSVMGLNLLSVGAAFGVLVLVFQHTWAQSLLGFTSNGAITDWLPLFAFVVLLAFSWRGLRIIPSGIFALSFHACETTVRS